MEQGTPALTGVDVRLQQRPYQDTSGTWHL
jgi:hypothetical protein